MSRLGACAVVGKTYNGRSMKIVPPYLICLLLAFGSVYAEEQATEAAEAAVTPSAEPTAENSTEAATAPMAEAPVISSDDTAAMEAKVGADVVIEGVVTNVGEGKNGGITFLNFGDRRTGFVAVVFRPAYEKFPEGFTKYAQQKVRIKGNLEKYQDRQLQIKVFGPEQIEVVAAEPAAP